MKREACLVCAYTPDFERTEILRNLINQLFKDGREIILFSHTPDTPKEIVSMCKYFIYSSENILIDDEKYRMYVSDGDSHWNFGTKININYKNTIIAAYDMFLNGLSFCKNLNYKIVHYIEYDCKFNDTSILDFSYEKLNTLYDTFSIQHENGELYGGMVSFKLDSFKYEDIKYDEEQIRKWTEELFIAEKITKKYILSDRNNYVYPFDEIKKLNFEGTIYKHTKPISHLSFPVIVEDSIKYIHCCYKNTEEDFLMIINNSSTYHKVFGAGIFYIFEVGKPEDVKNIKVVVDGKISYDYDLTDKELFDKLEKYSWVKHIDD